jgi:hypothetical protein
VVRWKQRRRNWHHRKVLACSKMRRELLSWR